MKEFCVDLEIAKELKKEGFPQESENWWLENINSGKIEFNITQYPTGSKTYYAPTSDEILKELPFDICDGVGLNIWRTSDNGEYNVSYIDWDEEDHNIHIDNIRKNDKKLSNALAKLWICVNKKGYIHENMGR